MEVKIVSNSGIDIHNQTDIMRILDPVILIHAMFRVVLTFCWIQVVPDAKCSAPRPESVSACTECDRQAWAWHGNLVSTNHDTCNAYMILYVYIYICIYTVCIITYYCKGVDALYMIICTHIYTCSDAVLNSHFRGWSDDFVCSNPIQTQYLIGFVYILEKPYHLLQIYIWVLLHDFDVEIVQVIAAVGEFNMPEPVAASEGSWLWNVGLLAVIMPIFEDIIGSSPQQNQWDKRVILDTRNHKGEIFSKAQADGLCMSKHPYSEDP